MEKKVYNYLYIEDETDKVVAQIQGLSQSGQINITLQKADSFEKLFEKKLFDAIDGLIVDYRLDGNKNGEEKAYYKAPSLAQELRNKILENEIDNDFPIILCSTDKSRIEPLQNDSTSEDLFDFRYLKDENFNATLLVTNFIELSSSYQIIKSNGSNVSAIIGRSLEEIDQQVFGKIVSRAYPPHEVARFIIHQFLGVPSVVVDEYLLAARLGIDIDSSKDWNKLKSEVFSASQYSGVFKGIWPRWWMDKVITQFKSITGKNLAGLDAKQRVDLLQANTGLELEPAKPIVHNKSLRYWTICQVYKKPLDPLEGYKINTKHDGQYTWQESQYVSFDACLERRLESNNITLNPIENQRFELSKNELNEAGED